MAFTYCHQCGEGQGAPTIDEFAYNGLHCRSCGVKRMLDDDWLALAIAAMRDTLVERLEALEKHSHAPVDFTPMLDRITALEAARLPVAQQPGRIVHIRGDEEPRARLARTPDRDRLIVPWFAVEDVKPPEREFLMVTGSSGYTGQTEFLCLAQYVPFESRPGARWLDEAGDGISGEYGYEVTHWAHRILLPGDLR